MRVCDHEFTMTLGDCWVIVNKAEEVNLVYRSDMAGRAIMSSELRQARVFLGKKTADQVHQEMVNALDLQVIQVKDILKPIYYLKYNFSNGMPQLKVSRMWVEKNFLLGDGMFDERQDAESCLTRMKVDMLNFYQEQIVETSRITLPSD